MIIIWNNFHKKTNRGMSHSSCLTDPVGSLWEHSGGKQVQLEEKVWTRNQLVSDGWTRHILPVDREGREPQNWMLRLIVLVPAIASTWHDSFESQFLVENLLGRLIQFYICRFNFWWLPFGFLFHLRIWKKDQRRTMIYDKYFTEWITWQSMVSSYVNNSVQCM